MFTEQSSWYVVNVITRRKMRHQGEDSIYKTLTRIQRSIYEDAFTGSEQIQSRENGKGKKKRSMYERQFQIWNFPCTSKTR